MSREVLEVEEGVYVGICSEVDGREDDCAR